MLGLNEYEFFNLVSFLILMRSFLRKQWIFANWSLSKLKTKPNETKNRQKSERVYTLANQYQKPFMSLMFLTGQKIVSGRSQERNSPWISEDD